MAEINFRHDECPSVHDMAEAAEIGRSHRANLKKKFNIVDAVKEGGVDWKALAVRVPAAIAVTVAGTVGFDKLMDSLSHSHVAAAGNAGNCVTMFDNVDHAIDNHGTVEFFDIAAIQACQDSSGQTIWNNLKKPGEKGYVYGNVAGSDVKDVSGYYFLREEDWGGGFIARLYRPVGK